ncbi:lipoprotein heptaprenylglyceryl N-acetyltransferase LhaT [Ureibacillus manganicus]|uniref:Membrane protein n=1 Tax=Ureibacillus manganicus DSM 26584 TaxID=1384049 RepID=A0A0A3I409_9BACL|nr:DUF1405 domain-containing protein [Ureibacillus manganicus]KGR79536.1 membrane protein [Ureibacillus manganicus DSM 26584]
MNLLTHLWYLLTHRTFLTLLLIVNAAGTIYGYIWYQYQLAITAPQFIIFVPDSPTASLFFSIAVIGWLLGKNFKLIEALALITLVKYGIWAVVMNLLTLYENGSLEPEAWMLVFSHFMMAVEAVIYIGKYRFTYSHVIIAAIWTLHNDVIDYVYGQFPYYHVVTKYTNHIGYFTFWLSIACIAIAFVAHNRKEYLHKL